MGRYICVLFGEGFDVRWGCGREMLTHLKWNRIDWRCFVGKFRIEELIGMFDEFLRFVEQTKRLPR